MTLRSALRPAAPGPRPAARAVRRRDRRLGLVMGLVLLMVLGGCAIPGLSSESSTASGADPDSSTAAEGAEWFWYQQGQRVASPSPTYTRPVSPSPTTDTPTRPVATPTGSATPYCLARLRGDTMYWLNATPGVGQASVTWMSLGDPRIVEYRIAAVLQNRPGGTVPPATWMTVPKPAGCQQMSATVTGLTSGSWYVIWLDVVVTTFPTGRREPMIGRSAAFLVQ